MLRWTIGTFGLSALAICLAGAAGASLMGCGSIALGNAGLFEESGPEVGEDAGLARGDAGGYDSVSADASASVDTGSPGVATQYTQSPLCGIRGLCDPDNPETTDSAEFAVCQGEAYPAPSADAGASVPPEDAGVVDDAGAVDSGSTPPSDAASTPPLDAGSGNDSAPLPPSGELACRVSPNDAGASVSAVCALPGGGSDGASCTTGQDCAAGFECVTEGAAGSGGVCRHYCCGNVCGMTQDGGVPTANPDAGYNLPFCTIEAMAQYPSNAVPVCVTRPSCTPFQPCPNVGEACTIVDSVGTTACVPEGSQGVGQSCEEAHCMGSLTCWGTFPTRTCQQLCDGANACPTGMTCQSNYSNFGSANAGLGVCLQ